jgi:hypothetical protein
MVTGRTALAIAIATVVFVLLSFFFSPAGPGPYSTTHGPVTALRAIRAAVLILIGMAMAAATLASALRRLLARGYRVGQILVPITQLAAASETALAAARTSLSCVLLC